MGVEPIMDEEKLMTFAHQGVGDVGTILGGSMVVLGDRPGR